MLHILFNYYHLLTVDIFGLFSRVSRAVTHEVHADLPQIHRFVSLLEGQLLRRLHDETAPAAVDAQEVRKGREPHGVFRTHTLTRLVVVRKNVAGGAFPVIQAGAVEPSNDALTATGQHTAGHVREAVEQRDFHTGGHRRICLHRVWVLGDSLIDVRSLLSTRSGAGRFRARGRVGVV